MKVILAVDRNRGIGKDGAMIYNIKKDLAHFKETTMGAACLMGKKTFDSIGSPLKGRENLILSRDKSLKIDGARVFNDVDEIISYTKSIGKEVFLIGGSQIVSLLLPLVDEAIITKIDGEKPADTYLHNFDEDDNFRIYKESDPYEEDGIYFKYVYYRREK
ncbi:MAG: dihydrofolate reductase [Anaerococcus sp.]|nr:dihydrofolate reductase [Anaerococcus sp.]